jgi:predicted nucleotidyltransferase
VRIFWPAFDRVGLVETLREGVRRLEHELPLVRVVLFGSQATGRATAASDVDLLIVYRGEPRSDAYALARRALRVTRLEPHLYTEGQYRQAVDVVERMARDGITLFPREPSSVVPS